MVCGTRRVIVSMIRSFFFFQAEDGIRDYKVTGVQTCALPISSGREEALVRHVEEPPRLQPGDSVGGRYASDTRGEAAVRAEVHARGCEAAAAPTAPTPPTAPPPSPRPARQPGRRSTRAQVPPRRRRHDAPPPPQ